MKYIQSQLTKFSQFFKDTSQLNLPLKLENYSDPIELYKKGHKIHIKKQNRGKFTESAKRAGMGVQEFASHVLSNKDRYSTTLVKRANFAKNAKSFNHSKNENQ